MFDMGLTVTVEAKSKVGKVPLQATTWNRKSQTMPRFMMKRLAWENAYTKC